MTGATGRQRILRTLTLALIGVGGGLLLSLDPLGAIRTPAFVALSLAMMGWTVVENLVLRRDEPKDYQGKRNTRLLQAGVMGTVFLGMIDLFHLHLAARPAWLVPVGLGILTAGGILRMVSIRTLDRHFTYELRVDADQPIIDRGPYRVLRHPSYLGLLLVAIGAALTATSFLAALVGGAIVTAILVARIRQEEAVLRSAFGGAYNEYATRTWALVPFVY